MEFTLTIDLDGASFLEDESGEGSLMDPREAAVLLQGLASRKHLLQDTARQVLTGDLDDILCEEQRERAALYAAARIAYRAYEFNLPRWVDRGDTKGWSDPPPEGKSVGWH